MSKSTKKRYTLADFNKALPSDVADKFEIIGLENRQSLAIVFPKFGKINFKKITLKRAEFLHKNEFPFIQKKKAPAKAKNQEN